MYKISKFLRVIFMLNYLLLFKHKLTVKYLNKF
jgi:hypothetical protein